MCSRKEPIPLRPHHGMCLAYFEGKGYSGEFTQNMGKMLELLQENPPVRLTVHTDRICRKCPNNREGICSSEEKVDHYDNAVLEYCGLKEGKELDFRSFTELVQTRIIEKNLRKSICGGCQWDDICSRRKSLWA